MGQDTYVNVGASVSLTLNWDNIKLITALIRAPMSDNIECNITGVSDCEDEIIKLDESDFSWATTDFMKRLVEIQTEEHFMKTMDTHIYTKSDETSKNIEFNFLISCVEPYARNISRRDIPYIYKHTSYITTDRLVEALMKAKQTFLSHGVEEDAICIGYSIMDSY